MPDGYLAAFSFGLAIGVIAIYFGAALRISDSFLNPFSWLYDVDDHWRR